ncbi:MAG: ATP-binding protein [Prolixibacteraceae bacterium]|nr:ATP-binding protein [Prolixibacteraceae bacterium]
MNREAEISSQGIRKILRNYKCTNAIAEFIWNGFDAKASIIDIDYKISQLGHIEYLSIKDNGSGINFTQLNLKFDKFYDSEKTIEIESPKHSSILHGKNGVGRLTFFTFANNAEWLTTYKLNGTLKGTKIDINSDNLKKYTAVETDIPFFECGTNVTFTNLLITETNLNQEVLPFITNEFCWFLELNKERNYQININQIPLDYSHLIKDSLPFEIVSGNEKFNINFVHWTDALNKEYSKFYYLNSESVEVFKDFTTLNRKGDQFYHSVYIKSSFFNNFNFHTQEDSTQLILFDKAKSEPIYKQLIKSLNEFLRSKRKPFLRVYAEQLVHEYDSSGIFPNFKNSWEQLRKTELEETIIGLYEVQPKLFTNLNLEQKKVFVRFLNLLLDSNERESIFSIMDEITSLDSEERAELSNLFKTTTLNRILSTIKLIEDRYKAYYQIKELVFNESIKADEVHHLQSIIENHYWIFGEEYHLVTAAEPRFNEALKRYVYLLRGEIIQPNIEHPSKYKEMDIFLCRQEKLIDKIHNVVVELKHPLIKLGEKQLSQVKEYMNVILSEDEFNANNMTWDFILVGNDFNKKNEIELALENARPHGEKSLVWKTQNYKIYVKKWSEVFNEFEIRHNFIDERLKLERAKLMIYNLTAKEIVDASIDSSALGKPELKIVN